MAYTPEAFAADLERVHERHLVAVILYGSAATGEHHRRWSDHNVLVVLDRMDADALARGAGPVRRWMAAGNRPPVTMTPSFLASSADAFPLEWLDMQDARRVLYGRDVLKGLRVAPAALRAELERELRTALLRLLSEVQAAGWFRRKARLQAILVRSTSTFQVLFRGVLRLGKTAPLPAKRDAVAALARMMKFEAAPFAFADRLKAGDRAARGEDPWPHVERMVESVEHVIARVDSWKR